MKIAEVVDAGQRSLIVGPADESRCAVGLPPGGPLPEGVTRKQALVWFMDGLAVTYGVHGRELLAEHGPLACLDSFSEVYAWLQQASGPLSVAAANS